MNYETLQVQSGRTPDETTLSGAVPVYQTTSHVFKNMEHAGKLFGLEHIDDIIADFKQALKHS